MGVVSETRIHEAVYYPLHVISSSWLAKSGILGNGSCKLSLFLSLFIHQSNAVHWTGHFKSQGF